MWLIKWLNKEEKNKNNWKNQKNSNKLIEKIIYLFINN